MINGPMWTNQSLALLSQGVCLRPHRLLSSCQAKCPLGVSVLYHNLYILVLLLGPYYCKLWALVLGGTNIFIGSQLIQ